MHPMKNDTAAVGYNAAYSTSEPRFSLSNAIALHARLERSCDALIQKQDDMIRAVALRCRSDAPEKHAPVSLTPLNSADDRPGANSQSGRCESIDRDAFAPLATPEFILQASKEEAESIETCEFEITLLRQHMRKVEDEIMKHSPLTPSDIARKVKFLSGLLADGGEVEIDAFAQLAGTGADMLLAALGEIGFF